MKRLLKWLVIIILVYLALQVILDWDRGDAVIGPYPTSGKASWYRGSLTASGERLRANSLTCAMRKRDYGKYYLVCAADSNRCVMVKHNDFGPKKKLFRQGRIIDLSHKAFSYLAKHKTGLIGVTVIEADKSWL